MASPPSSSSTQKSYTYDVFLSFRGEDTRKNFVDHLYVALQRQGIHTYKDDERLGKGKRINNELLNSIQDSKLFIVVFSMNYASSSWCLDELVKIMECQKATTEQIAYPVFYDVDPSEVRKQHGPVGKAFARHNNNGEAGKWREALTEAANLSGWDLRNTADGHEAKVIKKVVEDISLELRFNNSKVDENLVGMESRIRGFVSSLEMGVQDVRMIGIKGIGGGGKATLARAVFDSVSFSFEGKCFVENVREVSKSSPSGLRSLQIQVLSDVLNDRSSIGSVHEGKSVIRKMLCGKKVLLILDDVDHLEQLEALAGGVDWFLPGSRIIITTRDEQVLVAHGVKWIHDVNLLSQDEALCLFSRHAFGRGIPVQRYEELSLQVVYYAAGLPLAIRVLGSFLCGKDEPEWEDALRRLKTIPLHETLEKLELSYTNLEDDYKEIFLDVACLLKGWKKDHAIRALESCGFRARTGLRVLEQKSLISISSNQLLDMHDRIEEMGQNIVRRSHLRNSRLWIPKEIEDAIADDSVGAATRAIVIMEGPEPDKKNGYSKTFGKGFGNMKNLRFLHVDRWVFFNYSWYKVRHNLPNALCYLSWHGYPHFCLPKTFQGNNLVALDLSHSKIRRLWRVRERKVLENLRFLNFSDTKLRFLDGSLFPNLEKIKLERCSDLEELHVPFGCLRKLVFLCLTSCRKLMSFSFIKQLTSLQVLTIGNTNLTDFPMHSNYSLVKLNFVGNKIRELPSSIGNLQKLVSLDLSYSQNLKSLSPRICSLRCLKHLNLRQCPIEELPEDLGHLESLETLDLFNSRIIKCLPNSICMLKHLKTLNLGFCVSLTNLPEDLGLLESLEELELMSSKIRYVPSSICELKCLRKLGVSGCKQLETLPEKLRDLDCLKDLNLMGTRFDHLGYHGVRPFLKSSL